MSVDARLRLRGFARGLSFVVGVTLFAPAAIAAIETLFIEIVLWRSPGPWEGIDDVEPFSGRPASWAQSFEYALGSLACAALMFALLMGATGLLSFAFSDRWPRWRGLCSIPVVGLGVVLAFDGVGLVVAAV